MRPSPRQIVSSAIVCAALVVACGQDSSDPGDSGSVLPLGDSGLPGTLSDGMVSPGEGGTGDAGQPNVLPGDASVANDASTPRDAGSDARAASDAAASDGAVGAEAGSDAGDLPRFSFFVTSLNAMRTLSKNQNGFGGDFTYGETGAGAGLRGADKICADAAELGMPGASAKQWRAFLSTSTVHAKDRIGQGPWYDRKGRLIAMNLTALLKERPEGAEAVIRDDLPNENGETNRMASAEGANNDNHDTVTGTNVRGEYDGTYTCEDWTSTNTPSGGGMAGPRIGHSWPAQSGRNWMAAHRAPGCSPSVSLIQTGPGSGTGIGNGGGYGGIYCFALTP
jgi:hypothetical protein